MRRTGTPGRGVQGGPTHHVELLECRSRAVMTCSVYQFLFHALIKPSSSSFAIEPAVRLLVATLHVCVWAVSFPACWLVQLGADLFSAHGSNHR